MAACCALVWIPPRLFFDDDDRNQFYLLLLQEGVARYGHRIHGFCLMSQHVHLVLQVGDEPLAKNLQNVSFRHTRWINGKQQRLGPLVQGRCLENDSAAM